METLAQRVRFLVDKHHGGSVNRAATATGIRQQTLDRIVNGTVKNPRLRVLQQIADLHPDAPTEWLVLGRGPGPEAAQTIPVPTESLQWTELVLNLKLPDPASRALLGLPMTADAALHWEFDKQGRGTWRKFRDHPTAKIGVAVSPAIVEAIRLEHRAWILLVEDFIEAVGIEKARSAIIRSEVWLKARFVPEAILFFTEKRAKEHNERVEKQLATGRPAPSRKRKRKT